jgi:replication initiation and membrane attachment protein
VIVLRLEKFRLITYQNIDLDERNVITLLYQPLIGCKAFSLYNVLWSLIDRSRMKSPEYLHTKLFDLLDLNPESFIETRKILEAIGLLVVYQNEEMFLYELKAPVSAEEFIKDGMLGAYLYKKIGKVEFDDVVSLFRISNVEKDGFKNVTANFDDVFESIHEVLDTDDEFIRRNKSKISINHDFDFDIFLEGLSKNYVDKRKVTSKVKDQIINLSYIYSLDEITMQKVFMDSVDKFRNVNVDELSKSAKYWHYVLMKSNLIEDREYEEIKISNENVKELCMKYGPVELIAIGTGAKPSKSENNIIEKVFNELEFPKEILNFLLLYAMSKSQNPLKIPHFNFIETIYVQWKRNGVKSFEDAVNATIKYEEDQNRNGKKKEEKKAYEPDWVDDVFKEL